MARILHSVLVQDTAIGADGVQTFDLAVNPLSVVLVGIRVLNDTGTLANHNSYLQLCGAINRVSIFFQGATVLSMTGRDAAALAVMRHGIRWPVANTDDTTNERRMAVLPLLLGKWPYDPVSCFPASKRGELTLALDLDIADTGYDGLRLSVETIELLGIPKPKEWERKSDLLSTLGATGINDIDMPLGHTLRSVLAFGTTAFVGATPAPTLGRMSLFMDSEQVGYQGTDFEFAQGIHTLMGRHALMAEGHTHRTTTDGNAQTELTTLAGIPNMGSGGWENYALLDLDVTRDDMFSIDTKNARRMFFRTDAEAANAVRIIPVERVMVA